MEERDCDTCDVDETCDKCAGSNLNLVDEEDIMMTIRNKYLSDIASISAGRDVRNLDYVLPNAYESISKSSITNGVDSFGSFNENSFPVINRTIEPIDEEPAVSDENSYDAQHSDHHNLSKNPFLYDENGYGVTSLQENSGDFNELDTRDIRGNNLQPSFSIDSFLSNRFFFDEPFQKYCSDNDIYLKNRNKSYKFPQADNMPYGNNFFDFPLNNGHSSSVPALNLLDSKLSLHLVTKPPIPSPRTSYIQAKNDKILQQLQNDNLKNAVSTLSQEKISSNPFLYYHNTDISTPVDIGNINYMKKIPYNNHSAENTGKNEQLPFQPTNSEFNENNTSKFRVTKSCKVSYHRNVSMSTLYICAASLWCIS